MQKKKIRIAVIGAGLGGPATASLLQTAGYEVKVYEQSPTFSRIGAGINLSPNVTRILQRIGIGERLAARGARTTHWVSRAWDTGEVLLNYPMGEALEKYYGAPYLCVHRGDFHALLMESVAPGTIEFGKRLVDLDQKGQVVKLIFADGSRAEADLVIGADGVRSRCRELLVGLNPPEYSGFVAHRCIFPASLLADMELVDYMKWWGPGRWLFLTYFITNSRDEFFIVTSSPQAEWPHETSSVPANLDELRAAFTGFHPEVHQQIAAIPAATKWAVYDAEPLPVWSRGRVVLLGDACHAMTPYMGQGAAMAIEDGAMLMRCLEASRDDLDYALCLYEANRKDRTAAMQRESRLNTWLRSTADPDWVWGHDVFKEQLVPPLEIPCTSEHEAVSK
jgi:6-hydroxynicotinate 3-monooxygenase